MSIRFLRSSALGIAVTALISVPCLAATPSSTQQNAWRQNSWQNRKLISANAQLTHALSSQTATQGQIVTAKLTSAVKASGLTELPSGTMLMGKVKQVEISQNKGPAKIIVVFDEARLKDGREIPIKATLLAAYPPAPPYSMGGPDSYMPAQPHYIASTSKLIQEPGPLGHITLRSAVQSKVSGVFSSKDHDIDLHRGTRFQLAIAPEKSTTSQNGM